MNRPVLQSSSSKNDIHTPPPSSIYSILHRKKFEIIILNFGSWFGWTCILTYNYKHSQGHFSLLLHMNLVIPIQEKRQGYIIDLLSVSSRLAPAASFNDLSSQKMRSLKNRKAQRVRVRRMALYSSLHRPCLHCGSIKLFQVLETSFLNLAFYLQLLTQLGNS